MQRKTITNLSTPNPLSQIFVLESHHALPFCSFDNPTGTPPIIAELWLSTKAKHILCFENRIVVNRSEDWTELSINQGISSISKHLDTLSSLASYAKQSSTLCGQSFPEQAAVQELLDLYVLPALQSDGGSVSLVDCCDGVLYIKLHGACIDCPCASQTVYDGIHGIVTNTIKTIRQVCIV